MFGSIACGKVNWDEICHQERSYVVYRKFGRKMGGLRKVRTNAQIHIQVAVLDKYFNSEGKDFFFFFKIKHDHPVERILYCGSAHQQ